MRNNQPVTQHEYQFPEGVTLMSTTDTQSHIQYANEAFVGVSGFTREEIMGQPHNMVRHPDMPVEAYADMWATLKAGESWTALVKNRRKNGDHYWVRANATPMERGGVVTGYMSVRTKPRADEVAAAEELYKRIREGTAKGLAIYKGIVVRTGLMAWTSLFQTLSARWRMRLGCALAALVSLGAAALAGLAGPALGMVAGGVLVGALLSCVMMETQIAGPLEVILKEAQTVASGQTARINSFNRVDEIGMLMRAINQAGLNLRCLVDDVASRSDVVATASVQISTGKSVV